MPTVDGSVTVRAGSQDYTEWQLLEEDGSTVIDLTNATKATLHMKNKNTGAVKEFATDDATQKFFIKTAAQGKVELRPATTDFPLAAEFEFYVSFVDNIGVHAVPEHKNYIFSVINEISS